MVLFGVGSEGGMGKDIFANTHILEDEGQWQIRPFLSG